MNFYAKRAQVFPGLAKSIMVLAVLILTGACEKESTLVDTSQKEEVLAVIKSEKGIQGMPSVAFCVVKNERLLWSDAIGYADVDKKIGATPETRYLIASISKAVTAIALMQLYDRGLFKLDDDINKFLPFKVIHPKHPDVPITFKMLLNHTSSISDLHYNTFNMYCWNHDCPTPLDEYMRNFFTPGNQLNSPNNFYDYQPGEKANYTNNGFALIGYLVEVITKKRFDVYCKEQIFNPLGMKKTEWRLANIPLNELAIPYAPTITSKKPHYTFPDYPNGGLRTTVLDLSKILRMLIMKGTLDGKQILKSETVALMQKRTSSIDRGIVSFQPGLGMYHQEIGGRELYGHGGNEQGAATEMFFDANEGTGVIVFTNSNFSNLEVIFSSLFQYANQQ
jgi:CubicO group peptidase (beta-lactamase class C family)